MEDCKEFIQSGERTALGELKNACLKCGRTKESHSGPLEKRQEIHIWFHGKLFVFKDWEEARAKGFYLY